MFWMTSEISPPKATATGFHIVFHNNAPTSAGLRCESELTISACIAFHNTILVENHTASAAEAEAFQFLDRALQIKTRFSTERYNLIRRFEINFEALQLAPFAIGCMQHNRNICHPVPPRLLKVVVLSSGLRSVCAATGPAPNAIRRN